MRSTDWQTQKSPGMRVQHGQMVNDIVVSMWGQRLLGAPGGTPHKVSDYLATVLHLERTQNNDKCKLQLKKKF